MLCQHVRTEFCDYVSANLLTTLAQVSTSLVAVVSFLGWSAMCMAKWIMEKSSYNEQMTHFRVVNLFSLTLLLYASN